MRVRDVVIALAALCAFAPPAMAAPRQPLELWDVDLAERRTELEAEVAKYAVRSPGGRVYFYRPGAICQPYSDPPLSCTTFVSGPEIGLASAKMFKARLGSTKYRLRYFAREVGNVYIEQAFTARERATFRRLVGYQGVGWRTRRDGVAPIELAGDAYMLCALRLSPRRALAGYRADPATHRRVCALFR